MARTDAENSKHHKLWIVFLHDDVFNKCINSVSIDKTNCNIRHFPLWISLFSVNAITRIKDVYENYIHRRIPNVPSTLWHIRHKCSYKISIIINLKQRTRDLVDLISKVRVYWQQKRLILVHSINPYPSNVENIVNF
jgi:hypothetical protein